MHQSVNCGLPTHNWDLLSQSCPDRVADSWPDRAYGLADRGPVHDTDRADRGSNHGPAHRIADR